MNRFGIRLALVAAAALLVGQAGAAGPGSVVVTVKRVASGAGEVGCGLFRAADGFPMDSGKAVMQWQPARAGEVTCRFDQLPPGSYAVSASHDLNGNRRTDTNFLGIPREDWAVSNNVRPSMRAPRFGEAAFKVAADAPTRIVVELGR